MEGAGGALFNHFAGNKVGQGRVNLGKINKTINLYYFFANLQNEIKSFDKSFNDHIGEVLPRVFCLYRVIRAAGPGEWVHHGYVLF
jgi:hypothetical protein